jgi:hypothetical protein
MPNSFRKNNDKGDIILSSIDLINDEIVSYIYRSTYKTNLTKIIQNKFKMKSIQSDLEKNPQDKKLIKKLNVLQSINYSNRSRIFRIK